MVKMTIYDPAMCCSTGVCGPAIDPELLRVATVINNLSKNGIKVERYNLSNNPQAFVDNTIVNEKLNQDGIDVLPMTMVDGIVVKTKRYPTNAEFLEYLDIPESYLTVQEKPKANDCGCEGGCC